MLATFCIGSLACAMYESISLLAQCCCCTFLYLHPCVRIARFAIVSGMSLAISHICHVMHIDCRMATEAKNKDMLMLKHMLQEVQGEDPFMVERVVPDAILKANLLSSYSIFVLVFALFCFSGFR